MPPDTGTYKTHSSVSSSGSSSGSSSECCNCMDGKYCEGRPTSDYLTDTNPGSLGNTATYGGCGPWTLFISESGSWQAGEITIHSCIDGDLSIELDPVSVSNNSEINWSIRVNGVIIHNGQFLFAWPADPPIIKTVTVSDGDTVTLNAENGDAEDNEGGQLDADVDSFIEA